MAVVIVAAVGVADIVAVEDIAVVEGMVVVATNSRLTELLRQDLSASVRRSR